MPSRHAIVIEHPLGGQQKVDSLFKAYLAGNHKLSKSEVQQLGFRIAKMCKAKIYCADARGGHKQPASKNCWKTIARNNIRILKRVL